MKQIKSLKRELAASHRYSVTAKDTTGALWALVWCPTTKRVHVVAIEKPDDKPFNVFAYTMTKQLRDATVEALRRLSDDWWAIPLEDCDEHSTPLTLVKSTVESLCIGFNYGCTKYNLGK